MSKANPTIKLQKHWPLDFLPDETREFKEITKNFPAMLSMLTETSRIHQHIKGSNHFFSSLSDAMEKSFTMN